MVYCRQPAMTANEPSFTHPTQRRERQECVPHDLYEAVGMCSRHRTEQGNVQVVQVLYGEMLLQTRIQNVEENAPAGPHTLFRTRSHAPHEHNTRAGCERSHTEPLGFGLGNQCYEL
jgi:hypothetical protein